MKLIKLKEVMNKSALGRSTIYKFISEGKFPKSISLGDRAVAWLESDVDDWILERVSESSVS
jgi:prophage regulatory protein